MPKLEHLILTGATGYIGGRLLSAAQAKGLRVTVLSRSLPVENGGNNVRWLEWSLGEPPPDGMFEGNGGEAIIHLAHRWHDTSGTPSEDPNIAGTRHLVDAAREHGVKRFVFASSCSARQDALNHYGRTKWQIEQLLEEPDEVVARIGLVYGGPLTGLWGMLCRIVRLSPVLPMVDAGRPNQPIHIDDVCEGLLKLAEKEELDRSIYVLADPEPVPFGRILQLISSKVFGRRLFIIPIPFGLVMGLLDMVEKVPGIPPINRERLLGLAGIRTLKNADHLVALGLTLRPFAGGLAAERPNLRRLLLREATIVMRYLTRMRPSSTVLRHYVRGVLAYDGGQPIPLPLPVRLMPSLLALWDPVAALVGSPDSLASRRQKRIAMALRLSEATREGAALMYQYSHQSRVMKGAKLLAVLILETLFLPVRVVATLLWR